MVQTIFKPVSLQALEAPTPWQAWLAPAGEHPMAEAAAKPLRIVVERIADALTAKYPLKLEAFLQINELHLGEGSELVQDKAIDWMPSTGLGIFPDRDPPRPWTREDFEELEEGQAVRPLMHQVLRLAGEPPARRDARSVMLGKGSYLELMVEQDGEAMLGRLQAALEHKVVDRMFKGFTFLCPLLDAAGVAGAADQELDGWLAGARLYARDSIEDKGMLLLSKHPLEDVFGSIGGRSEKDGWSFALE